MFNARLRFRKNSLFAAKVIIVDILACSDASAMFATREEVPARLQQRLDVFRSRAAAQN